MFFQRGNHAGQDIPFHLCSLFYLSRIGQCFNKFVQNFSPDFLTGHHSTAETHNDLNFFGFFEPLSGLRALRIEVPYVNDRTQLELFDLGLMLILLCFLLLFLLFKTVFAVIH